MEQNTASLYVDLKEYWGIFFLWRKKLLCSNDMQGNDSNTTINS